MRTTLDLPDPLFKELKMRAVQQGTTLKDLLARYIESGLRGSQHPPAKRSAPPFAIARIPESALHPALTNEQLHQILESEELDTFRPINPPSAITK